MVLVDLGVEGVMLVGVVKGVECWVGYEVLVLLDGCELCLGVVLLVF